jgi:CheY-like chemotaxis protein
MIGFNSQSRHILVLEDEPTQRELLAVSLSRVGYQVSTAAQVSTALSLAHQAHFDVIIADYDLSALSDEESSGAGFVNALRAIDEYERIPLIMLTSKVHQPDLDYLRNDLRAVVLSKPLDTPNLLTTISWCIGRHTRRLDACKLSENTH